MTGQGSRRISWKKLKGHHGSAAKLPKAIGSFIDGGSPSMAIADFSPALMHPDKWKRAILPPDERWVEATAPAIDLFLSGVERATRPEWVLGYVAEFAGALHEDGWLGAPESYLPEDIAEVLRTHLPTLERAVKNASPAVRAAACLVLALEPASEADAVRHLFATLVEDDVAPTVRASALLGLARYASDGDLVRIEALLGDPLAPPLLRGAACLARLRIDPAYPIDQMGAAVECWLSIPPEVDSVAPLAWFGSGLRYPVRSHLSEWTGDAAWAMFQLARRWGAWNAWCGPILDIGQRTESPVVRRAISDLLLRIEFPELWEIDHLPTRSDFSDHQLAVLRKIGDGMLLVRVRALPGAGPGRMRHFGWAPPGLMETPVVTERAGKQVRETITTSRARRGDAFLPEVARLSAAERWRVLTELSTTLYFPGEPGVKGEEFARLVDAAANDPGMTTIAPPVIDEIANWYQHAQSQYGIGPMDAPTSDLILLAAARAGIRFKPAWECLLPAQLAETSAADLVRALPEERRSPWLLRNRQSTEILIMLLPCVPGVAFAAHYMKRLLEVRAQGEYQPAHEALEARIRELATTEERFAQAIREAEAEFAKG
jgi:hypothetical protein